MVSIEEGSTQVLDDWRFVNWIMVLWKTLTMCYGIIFLWTEEEEMRSRHGLETQRKRRRDLTGSLDKISISRSSVKVKEIFCVVTLDFRVLKSRIRQLRNQRGRVM